MRRKKSVPNKIDDMLFIFMQLNERVNCSPCTLIYWSIIVIRVIRKLYNGNNCL